MSRIGPGATTANAVAYLGNKIAGFWGGLLATLCYTIAPMIVIIAIYGLIEQLLNFSFVASAVKGCLVCICVIFVKSTVDMGKSVLIDKFNIVIFVVALVIAFVFDISCIWIIIGSIVVGGVKIFLKNKNISYDIMMKKIATKKIKLKKIIKRRENNDKKYSI